MTGPGASDERAAGWTVRSVDTGIIVTDSDVLMITADMIYGGSDEEIEDPANDYFARPQRISFAKMFATKPES